ncbi:hypothetical protein CLU79DRAFT_891364 [Phycomyces nitens]|nr:hypothetical protein CLU79DRAFT_891364 [Phycomyces nitens]
MNSSSYFLRSQENSAMEELGTPLLPSIHTPVVTSSPSLAVRFAKSTRNAFFWIICSFLWMLATGCHNIGGAVVEKLWY